MAGIRDFKLAFTMTYIKIGAHGTVWRCKTFVTSGKGVSLLDFIYVHSDGGRKVDLTLRLNVLAVCAAIVFVGAILFGAF